MFITIEDVALLWQCCGIRCDGDDIECFRVNAPLPPCMNLWVGLNACYVIGRHETEWRAEGGTKTRVQRRLCVQALSSYRLIHTKGSVVCYGRPTRSANYAAFHASGASEWDPYYCCKKGTSTNVCSSKN